MLTTVVNKLKTIVNISNITIEPGDDRTVTFCYSFQFLDEDHPKDYFFTIVINNNYTYELTLINSYYEVIVHKHLITLEDLSVFILAEMVRRYDIKYSAIIEYERLIKIDSINAINVKLSKIRGLIVTYRTKTGYDLIFEIDDNIYVFELRVDDINSMMLIISDREYNVNTVSKIYDVKQLTEELFLEMIEKFTSALNAKKYL